MSGQTLTMRRNSAYCLAVGTALADRLFPGSTANGAAKSAVEPGVAAFGTLPARAADSIARILDAALKCVARFGIGKTTVDDVAREAGLSRATLYRLFPGGREELVRMMVSREVAGYFEALRVRLAGVDDLESQLVLAVVAASEAIVSHEALRTVMAHEPEVLLPHVSFSELDGVLEAASGFLAPYLCRVIRPDDARRVGEWIARLALSYIVCSHEAIEAAWSRPRQDPPALRAASPFAIQPEALSPERARWLVHQFVMPGIRALAVPERLAETSTFA